MNFGGKPLPSVQFTTKEAMTNLLGELVTALHYLKLAGIVHHDLKGDNIMYTENVDSTTGKSVGGHIVVIDFGSLLPNDPVLSAQNVFLTQAFTPGFGPYAFEL